MLFLGYEIESQISYHRYQVSLQEQSTVGFTINLN